MRNVSPSHALSFDSPADPSALGGRERLILAALRLASRTRSLPTVGIRELAREADLNPNTFYRHFSSVEELGLAALKVVADELKPLLHLLQEAAAREDATSMFRKLAEGYFDFAAAHPEAILLGLAELHGGSQVLRRALHNLLDELAEQMSADTQALGLIPGLPAAVVKELCSTMVVWFFQAAGRVVEFPAERAGLTDAGENMARRLVMGAMMEHNLLSGMVGALKLRSRRRPAR